MGRLAPFAPRPAAASMVLMMTTSSTEDGGTLLTHPLTI
jgi:hypothetical protein